MTWGCLSRVLDRPVVVGRVRAWGMGRTHVTRLPESTREVAAHLAPRPGRGASVMSSRSASCPRQRRCKDASLESPRSNRPDWGARRASSQRAGRVHRAVGTRVEPPLTSGRAYYRLEREEDGPGRSSEEDRGCAYSLGAALRYSAGETPVSRLNERLNWVGSL